MYINKYLDRWISYIFNGNGPDEEKFAHLVKRLDEELKRTRYQSRRADQFDSVQAKLKALTAQVEKLNSVCSHCGKTPSDELEPK